MPDYKQSTVSGTAWQRCHQVVLDNPLGGVPVIRFDEQTVLSIDGRETTRPAGSLSLPFDPSQPIALRDPATGALTGDTSTYGAVYVLIYSAYMAAAEARDAALAPPAEPTV
jgi:hypothetical protein